MATPILQTKIKEYAKKLKDEKKFPSYASGAEYSHCKKVAHSGDIKNEDFVKSLKIELLPFGKLGEKFENSSIGYCAETVSANKVLQQYPSKLPFLSVGIAIRPKTLQRGKRCKICNSLF